MNDSIVFGRAALITRCRNVFPVVGGDGTKKVPVGDIFHQPPGEMSSIRVKLADRVGDHVDLSPEGVVLATSSGTESSYPLLPQSLNGIIIVKVSEGESICSKNCVLFLGLAEDLSHREPSHYCFSSPVAAAKKEKMKSGC